MVKPSLVFVNFFREARGRRVVEVNDVTVPDDKDHPKGWPRHHSDFIKDLTYKVKWPHIPNEGSFSTSSEYDAKILCFGVSMEDLIHEAKSTGYKIPQADIEKYSDAGQPASKVKSPASKTSSKGRKIKQLKLNAVSAPPIHAKRKKKPTMEDQSRRARNSEFVNSIQLPFPDESDINAQVKPLLPTTLKSGSRRASGKSNSKPRSESQSAALDNFNSKSWPGSQSAASDKPNSKASKAGASDNHSTQAAASLKKALKNGSSFESSKPRDLNAKRSLSEGRPSPSSAGAYGSPYKKDAGKASNLKPVVVSCSSPTDKKNECKHLGSNKSTNSSARSEILEGSSAKKTTPASILERTATPDHQRSSKIKKCRKDRIKDVLSSSEDDDSVSYVSSKDAAEAQTNLYLTKIQKLEIELKKLKRENLAMRNSGSAASQSEISSQSPSTGDVSSKSAKRSLFDDGNCDYADNATIAQMIIDSYQNKAPLRKDGTGKVHIGNGQYLASKVFEDKLMASKVSPSIATRDLMSQIYTTQEMAERSLEGGTPVKGGADRKKMKKNRLTPAKRECLFGLFRAKTQIQTGSSDKNFLDLSVEKKGKSTVRDKLKEAARKVKQLEEEKATKKKKLEEEQTGAQDGDEAGAQHSDEAGAQHGDGTDVGSQDGDGTDVGSQDGDGSQDGGDGSQDGEGSHDGDGPDVGGQYGDDDSLLGYPQDNDFDY